MTTVIGLNSLLTVLLVARAALGMDVFCGTLTIFEQQRFGLHSVAISSQETKDLKQCLELCCAVRNCHGVTLTGVIVPHEGEPNCLLVGCRDQCTLNERAEYADGLVTVLINRTQDEFTSTTTSSSLFDESTPSSNISSSLVLSSTIVSDMSSTAKSTHRVMSWSIAPVWAVGLAILIAIVCVGINIGLLSAYICYRRKKSRKQTAHITINKGPTLHAYNPTI